MSKHETWRTREYWKTQSGLLIEEFLAVHGNNKQGKRLIDGVIVIGEPTGIHDDNTIDQGSHDVVCIKTKKGRLGKYLLG